MVYRDFLFFWTFNTRNLKQIKIQIKRRAYRDCLMRRPPSTRSSHTDVQANFFQHILTPNFGQIISHRCTGQSSCSSSLLICSSISLLFFPAYQLIQMKVSPSLLVIISLITITITIIFTTIIIFTTSMGRYGLHRWLWEGFRERHLATATELLLLLLLIVVLVSFYDF